MEKVYRVFLMMTQSMNSELSKMGKSFFKLQREKYFQWLKKGKNRYILIRENQKCL